MTTNSMTFTNIRILKGLILTTALVNNKEVTMVVDSGAPTIIVNQSPDESSDLESFEGIGGSGQSDIVEIDSFEWCGLKLESLSVPAIDLSHLEEEIDGPFYGLIGYQQIMNHSFMIDYDANQFHLWSDFKEDEFNIKERIPFEMKAHVPLIQGEVEGSLYHFALDSGAAANLLDISLREKLKDFVAHEESDELVGADKSKQTVEHGTIPLTKIGSTEFKDMNTVWSDIDHIKQAFGEIDGLLGYEFFKNHKIVVSFPNETLYIRDESSEF